jgi:hypothetical protein
VPARLFEQPFKELPKEEFSNYFEHHSVVRKQELQRPRMPTLRKSYLSVSRVQYDCETACKLAYSSFSYLLKVHQHYIVRENSDRNADKEQNGRMKVEPGLSPHSHLKRLLDVNA